MGASIPATLVVSLLSGFSPSDSHVLHIHANARARHTGKRDYTPAGGSLSGPVTRCRPGVVYHYCGPRDHAAVFNIDAPAGCAGQPHLLADGPSGSAPIGKAES